MLTHGGLGSVVEAIQHEVTMSAFMFSLPCFDIILGSLFHRPKKAKIQYLPPKKYHIYTQIYYFPLKV